MLFSTPRLIIRRFTVEDKDAFFRLSGSKEVMRYIRPPSTKEESDLFLEENIAAYEKDPSRGRWAVIEKQSGELIGTFAIIPIPSQPDKTQLGYSFIPSHWGKGLATELAKAGLAWFFAHEKITMVVYGVTEVPNLQSQNVLLKVGFVPEGSFVEKGKELLLFMAERENK